MRKNKIKAISVFILFLCITFTAQSQAFQSIELDNDTISVDHRIPGVEEFIQSALKNSPLMKIPDVEMQQILEKIKIEKKKWSDYLYADGIIRYGLNDQLIVNGQTGASSTNYTLNSANKQLTYYGGLSIKLPLSDFLSKKSQLKILNYTLNENKYRKEQTELELTNIVIEEYYKLIKLNQILQVYLNVLETLKISYLKAQKDIANGLMEINDFASIVISKGKAEEGYYNAQNDYYTQYRKIQVLSGLNLNLNSKK